jgi:hypothetical protein
MRELYKLDDGISSEQNPPIILIYANIRTVVEVGGVLSGLQNLHLIRRLRNFVVIANKAGRALVR